MPRALETYSEHDEPAEMNRRRLLAATAVAFILVVVCTAGGLTKASLAKAQGPVLTTERGSPLPDERPRDAVAARASSEQQPAPGQRKLTLGDVLFTSGGAELKPTAIGNLNKLVNFLAKYRDHSVAIQGYTDSVGDEKHNQELSERRANSVKAYLVAHGIDSMRLFAAGMGQSNPVAGNDSGAGRQQNRRAEVIIENPPAALPQTPRTTKMIVLLMLLESVSGHSGRPFL